MGYWRGLPQKRVPENVRHAGEDATEAVTVGSVMLHERETSWHPGYPHEVVTHIMQRGSAVFG
jgi:hypothetical protein